MVFLIGFLIHLRHIHHTVSSICTMFLSRFQTRCKHPIYSYPNVQARLSFCTYFLLYPLVITLQDWSVNHVRKLKCQPCMEAAQLMIHCKQPNVQIIQSNPFTLAGYCTQNSVFGFPSWIIKDRDDVSLDSERQ